MDVPTIGIVATTLSSAAFLPQTIKTTISGHTTDQSLSLYVLLMAAGACWYAYGHHLKNQIVQVSSVAQLGLVSCVLMIKLSNVLGGVDGWS
jgi:MtN3 and saliva related transmembrane protein